MDPVADTPDLTEAAFDFWFRDHDHIRSPFPMYIREALREQALKRFTHWCTHLKPEAKKEVNDEIFAEKFEEILFETGMGLVVTEDEKLSIRYPFMPRIGDVIRVQEEKDAAGESKVTDRFYHKRGDEAFLKVKLIRLNTNEAWETEFELPD
ncbi:MAG: hypothetical protein IT233_01740 [Bacteroidia bacterium]|nr:hypothetical protein [Bacteroidia bacterium]